MRGSDERRQHVVVFEVSQGKRDSQGDADHVLLRARRLHLAAEAAAEAAMTEEERMEMEAARLFEGT